MAAPNSRRRRTYAAAVCTAVALLTGNPAADDLSLSPVVEGLDSPRGIAVGPAGRVLFTQGDGSFGEAVTKGNNAGTAAAVTMLGGVPATYIAPAIASDGRGQIYVLTAGGPPGSGAATLYRSTAGGMRPVADIAAYQQTDPDPYNLADDPAESNPFGVATLPDGSVLVSDAAANDLLRVYPNGRIITVARLRPRMVPVPPEIVPFGFPPAGTLLPSEDVATSVTVGADGYYYVGELRGVPATPGYSQVWRIAPNSVDALCDPEAPNTGACRRYADGFTSIVSLAAGRDGSIYVAELVKQSWFQWSELHLVDPPIGAVFRIPPGGGAAVELAPGELLLPAGLAVGRDGAVFVSNPVFGPGAVSRIQ